MKVYGKNVWWINVDEGDFVSILYSSNWQSMTSPQILPVTKNILSFNRTVSEPLGILPELLMTVEGKLSVLILW